MVVSFAITSLYLQLFKLVFTFIILLFIGGPLITIHRSDFFLPSQIYVASHISYSIEYWVDHVQNQVANIEVLTRLHWISFDIKVL